MNALVLHHLKAEELPAEWANQLPRGLHFTITITPEKAQANAAEDLENAPPLFGIWQDRAGTQVEQIQSPASPLQPSQQRA